MQAKFVFEALGDILKPKEGAIEELNQWKIRNMLKPVSKMEAEFQTEWIDDHPILSTALGFKGGNDVYNLVGFDLDNAIQDFPGDYDLIRDLIENDFTATEYLGKDNNTNFWKGKLKDGSTVIFYQGGLIDGYIARKDWLTANEAMGDILKGKSDQEIVEDFSNEILMRMQAGKGISFYKSFAPGSNRYSIFDATWNIDESFNKLYKEHGPGFYLLKSSEAKPGEIIPLQHIFPQKILYKDGRILKIDVPPNKLEMAIKELVANTYINKDGNGFHIKYFRPEDEKA